MPELTNPRAERVRAVRALAGRSARRRQGAFLVEGPQAVREAVRESSLRVRALYVTEQSARRYPEILDDAVRRGVQVRTGSAEVLEAMSADAQEVVAVADQRPVDLDQILSRGPRLVAVLAHVRDPGNAGTVIRAADAAGVDAVVLTEQSVDVHNPKVVRSTAGSLFHLPVVTGVKLAEVVRSLRGSGLLVLAADGSGDLDLDELLDRAELDRASAAGPQGPSGPGVPSGRADLTRPTAWVFGNEAWGLAGTERGLADAVVRVPIRGSAESLNLATAAALCLYASARSQRRVARGDRVQDQSAVGHP